MCLSPYPDINGIEITIAGVKKLLLGLDPSKSPGSDKIPGKLLKVMASEIAPYFSLVLLLPSTKVQCHKTRISFGHSTI